MTDPLIFPKPAPEIKEMLDLIERTRREIHQAFAARDLCGRVEVRSITTNHTQEQSE